VRGEAVAASPELGEQDVDLVVRHGAVLDAFEQNKHLTRVEEDGAIADDLRSSAAKSW
jgi:hypothetical protein